MATLAEVRAKYPEYGDWSDTQLAQALHRKFYSDMPFADFAKRAGLGTSKESLKATNPAEYDPESPEYKAKYGAASDSGWQNFAAGIGKGVMDIGRGIGQMLPRGPMGMAGPMVTRDDIKEVRARDADLMDTTAGKVGQGVGMAATLLPTMFIPGANTLAGSAAIGAGTGLAMPSESTDETLKNVALGGLLSPATMLGMRGVAAVGRAGKGIVEPFTRGGQERIAGRTLRAFAGGDDAARAAADAIDNAPGSLPGYRASTAELADNAGLAQLDRSLRNNPEYVNLFAQQDKANRTAIVGALDDLAKDPAQRQAAVAARESATDALYKQADTAVARADADFGKLMMRPSMSKAWARAEELAAESGEQISRGPEISGRALHYVKKALDDLADTADAGNQQRAVLGTRKAFLEWVDKQVPAYGQARQAFQDLSQPINQMDVGQALKDKLLPPLADFGADRMTPNSFAQAVRAGDATAAKATGFSGARMDKVLSKSQMETVTKIGEQLARKANADALGAARGSPTAQNLISQNLLRQTLGPFGLPDSMLARAAESTFMQSAMRPAQFAGKLGEQRVMGLLSEAALDPQTAAKLLKAGVSPQLALEIWKRQGLLAPMGAGLIYSGQ